jgi:hypothetical protein
LNTVGQIAKKSLPVVEQWVSIVYNTIASGVELGKNTLSKKMHSIAGGRRGQRKTCCRRTCRRHRKILFCILFLFFI